MQTQTAQSGPSLLRSLPGPGRERAGENRVQRWEGAERGKVGGEGPGRELNIPH